MGTGIGDYIKTSLKEAISNRKDKTITKDDIAKVVTKSNLQKTLESFNPRNQESVKVIDPLNVAVYKKSEVPTEIERLLNAHEIPGTNLMVAPIIADSQTNDSMLQESLVGGIVNYLNKETPQVLQYCLILHHCGKMP
jgi:galactose-1-phosphate uridylyltransferase